MRKNVLVPIGICVLIVLLAVMLVACDPAAGNTPQKVGNTIYFVTNGGSRVDPITAPAGTPITPPADPVKEGYFFVGWYLTRQATGVPETLPKVMPSKNVTYYAGWSDQGTRIVLDPNGGELETTELSAAIGAKLTELLRPYVPTVEEGIEFAGWYKNGELIQPTDIVGTEVISLQARYQAYYTVNVFKEGLDGQLALDENESINELVFVGTRRTYTYKNYEGYERTSDLQNRSKELTVGMHPADNVIDVRYSRLRVTVQYLKGAEGVEGEEQSFSMPFGGDLTLIDNPFSFERHRFAGWRVGSKLFEEGAELSEEDMSVSAGNRVEIVAVWDERFDDIGGGVDELWLLGKDNGRSVELIRENLPLMQGTVSSGSDIFRISLSTGELRGKLLRDSGLFTWDIGFSSHTVRYVVEGSEGYAHANDYAKLDDPEASELHIGGETLKGTFNFDNANGAYKFTTESGEIRYFSIVEVEGRNYFVLRDDLLRSYSYFDGEINYEFIFGERGIVSLYRGARLPYWMYKTHFVDGSYSEDDGVYKINIAGTAFVNVTAKPQAYGRSLIFYDSSLDGTFGVEQGGSLKLDGYSGATYTDKDGVAEEGEFYVVDGDVVFFGKHRSQHFALRSGAFSIKGGEEVYRAYVSANGAESIVINGHGKLRYVNSHGRVFYANYDESELDAERQVLRFPIDVSELCFLLFEDVATPTGAEAGAYASGGEKLCLDGMGNAVYDDGRASYSGTYALRDEAPFDYQLSGEASFRFVLQGENFKKHNADIAGSYVDKFDPQSTLFFDGYGMATITNESGETEYILTERDGYYELTAYGTGIERVRAGRIHGLADGVYVKYDVAREYSVNFYDPSYFDEFGDNIDEQKTLAIDGYDGVTFTDGGAVTRGTLMSVNEDGELVVSTEEGERKLKVFEYPLATTPKPCVFAEFDEANKLSLSGEDGQLETDGYGEIVFTPVDGEAKAGFYSLWGSVLLARGGDFSDIIYFNVTRDSFARCNDVIVDGGVVKRFIGDGGDVEIPSSANSIAAGAFRGSNVRSVRAARLDGGIGASAFEGCAQLEEFSATTIGSIGEKCFYGCEKLATVSGSSAAGTVGAQAFAGCAALERIDLGNVNEIGFEAFAHTNAGVTVFQPTVIADRAFAHGDGDRASLVWTAKNASEMPTLEGDPFVFDGEGEDLFMIVVEQRSQLQQIFSDSAKGWDKFAGYVAFADAEAPFDELYSVTELTKIKFGQITEFDSRRWTLFKDPNTAGLSFISYDGTQQSRIRELAATADKERGTLELGDGYVPTYKFVLGGELTYEATDGATLTITLADADELAATFNGETVTLSRATLSFTLGDYDYVVTRLFAHGIFEYDVNYIKQEVASYRHATDGDSQIMLYATNADGTDFAIEGNYLLVSGERYDFADVKVLFYNKYTSSAGDALRFFIYIGDDCVLAEFTFDEGAGTYEASAKQKFNGKKYSTTPNSNLRGNVTLLTAEGDEQPSRVLLEVEYDGETYLINVDYDRSRATISGNYPSGLTGTYNFEFVDRFSQVTVTKV